MDLGVENSVESKYPGGRRGVMRFLRVLSPLAAAGAALEGYRS